MVFSPDGKILVGATRSGVSAWDVSTGIELYRLPWGVPAISADGKTLGIWDIQELRLCELHSGKQLRKVQLPKVDIKDGPPSPTHCLCFAPDSKTCAVARGKSAFVIEVASGTVVATLKTASLRILSFAFSPDSRALAMSTVKPNVQFWDIATGKIVGVIDQPPYIIAGHVAYAPDGKTLAWTRGLETFLSDPATGQELCRLTMNPAGSRPVLNGKCLLFTKDGKTLAEGHEDGSVIFWDVASAKVRLTLNVGLPFHSMAMAPDGNTVAIVPEQSSVVKLWDVASGKELHTAFQGDHCWEVSQTGFFA